MLNLAPAASEEIDCYNDLQIIYSKIHYIKKKFKKIINVSYDILRDLCTFAYIANQCRIRGYGGGGGIGLYYNYKPTEWMACIFMYVCMHVNYDSKSDTNLHYCRTIIK